MWDLYLGLLILAALSVGFFYVGLRVARHGSRWVVAGTVLVVTALLLLFAINVHGKLLVAVWLPFSNALVVGNWIPLGAAVLGGVLAGQKTIVAWRRALFAGSLLAVAWYSVLLNFVPDALEANDNWTDEGVCLQSSEASCSACAAATLLRHYGIEASEREMMTLCLTREDGSPSLGLYRGLKIKTQGTPWKVEVVRCRFDEFEEAWTGPVVLRMRLPGDEGTSSGLMKWLGLEPDAGHAMVLDEFIGNDRVQMADPSVGMRKWTADDIAARWRGEGLRLVPRE